jgi:hypothetical protein
MLYVLIAPEDCHLRHEIRHTAANKLKLLGYGSLADEVFVAGVGSGSPDKWTVAGHGDVVVGSRKIGYVLLAKE